MTGPYLVASDLGSGGCKTVIVDSCLRIVAAAQREYPTSYPRPGWVEQNPTIGGIGIHGHVAFNEPGVGVKDSNPRILSINDFTRTVDSTRHGLGGNLINFPRRAITLGLRQCLGARKILLMTRNEYKGMDWSNTALRIATLGRPGDDYPVTHIRDHANYTIATDFASASAPETII